MNRSLCVLYTGGTFGMRETPRGLVPAPLEQQTLAAVLGPQAPDFTLVSLAPLIDSADATPADWRRIAEAILAHNSHDAFVVLHGTDTMAYSASAISFLLRGLGKPVVFTGAQVPLGRVGGDAEGNLRAAVAVAVEEALHEVVILFGGRVLRGNRARKLDAHAPCGFGSPNSPELASIGASGIDWNHSALWRNTPSPLLPLPTFIEEAVVSWRFSPGHSLTAFERLLDSPTHAVLIEAYGAGSGPGGDPRLARLISAAHARGVMFVAVSQCLVGSVDQSLYASGQALADSGMIGGYDITVEAAYAKLHVLLAHNGSAADFKAVWCGEMTVS